MVWKCTCKFVYCILDFSTNILVSLLLQSPHLMEEHLLNMHLNSCIHWQHRKERHLPSVCVHGSSSWKTESVSASSSDSCSNKNQCVYIPSHKRSKHCTLKIPLLIHNLLTDKHGEYSLSLESCQLYQSLLSKKCLKIKFHEPLTKVVYVLTFLLFSNLLYPFTFLTNSVGAQTFASLGVIYVALLLLLSP